MTRILLALLLTTSVGCCLLERGLERAFSAEARAARAAFCPAIESSFTLAFAGVGLDIRWAWVPGGPLGERAGDGTG